MANEATRAETLKAQQQRQEVRSGIYSKYNGQDYRVVGDDAYLEHEAEHERYKNVLMNISSQVECANTKGDETNASS